MTYRLNVCSLSPIFEKRFGVAGFSEDYHSLINGLDSVIDNISGFCYSSYPDTISYVRDWAKNYRLFCKLSHFFDDFNFFINIQLTQERYSKFSSVDEGFRAFIRRVESMEIPQQTQDTIAGFLKVQRARAFVATREQSWLVPNLLQSKNLHMISGKPKNCPSTDEDRKRRLSVLAQISCTWGKFPELRLGQLISNSIPEGTDISYVTDDRLIQLLKDFEAQH
jgi:hypothetical protein